MTAEGGKSYKRLTFQFKWGCIYTRESSCDLLTPLYFRCSYWLLLIESPGDWLISNTSRTFRCLLVLGFSPFVPSSFPGRDQHHVISACLVISADVLMTLSLGRLEVSVLG